MDFHWFPLVSPGSTCSFEWPSPAGPADPECQECQDHLQRHRWPQFPRQGQRFWDDRKKRKNSLKNWGDDIRGEAPSKYVWTFVVFTRAHTWRWLHMQSKFWSFVVRRTSRDKPKTLPFYNAKPGATMAGLIKSPGKRSSSMYKSKHGIHYPLPQNFSHNRSTPVDLFIRGSHQGGLIGSRCEPWSIL